jgi:hypothetical protein
MNDQFLLEHCPEPSRDEPEDSSGEDASLGSQVDKDQAMWERFDRLIAETGSLVKRM